MMQVQTAVDHLSVSSPAASRLYLVHCSPLPPTWEVERQLALLLVSLGQTKTALDVFLRLEMWDEVIVCYNQLQLRHKAAEVIRQQLAKCETARLWCQLGDATDDVSHYHTALTLSGNKSARAYRSLGLNHYYKKEYITSIDYFKKSLDCSRFQLDVLIRLGFAAMEVTNWEVAATAYRKYCALESDNLEAWNNLANCYIKMGNKERAWRVLQELCDYDYDNWKVWDNICVISTDLAIFDEVIRSYNRILDIGQAHVDQQVLEILTTSVLADLVDSDGQGSSRHRPSVLKLLARLTVAHPREAVPWRLYGRLLSAGGDEEELQRGVQCLQKGLAAAMGARGWDKDEDKCRVALEAGREVLEAVGRLGGGQGLSLAASARMSVNSLVKQVRASRTSVESGRVEGKVGELLEEVTTGVEEITEKIKEMRAGQ